MLNFDIKSTAFKSFSIVAILIAYGHLYPFEFKDIQVGMEGFRELLLQIVPSNIPDMASNIFVFIPFGFMGTRSFHKPLHLFLHSIQIIIIGFIFAYILQILQLFVVSRVPSLLDAILNTAGCTIGAFAGAAEKLRFFGGQRGKELWNSAPMLLAGSVVLYMTLPMIPALDIVTLKKSFYPLYGHPDYSYVSIFKYFTFWLVFIQLVSAARHENLSMLRVILFVFIFLCSQIIIASKQLDLSTLIGSGISIIAWFFLKRMPNKIIIGILAVLLFIYQTHYALYPFHFLSYNKDFNWLPLYGLMNASILLNTIVFFKKFFVFGSFMLFLEGLGANWGVYTGIGMAWISIMEIIQIRLDGEGHVPEITDPLFILLIGLWLKSFRHIKYRPENRDIALRGKERDFKEKSRFSNPKKHHLEQDTKDDTIAHSQMPDRQTATLSKHPQDQLPTQKQAQIDNVKTASPIQSYSSYADENLKTPTDNLQFSETELKRQNNSIQLHEAAPVNRPARTQLSVQDSSPTQTSVVRMNTSMETAETSEPAAVSETSYATTTDSFSSQLIFTSLFRFSVWTAIILALYWFPYNFVPDQYMLMDHLNKFSWIPFYSYYENDIYYALMQILGVMFFFIPNGIILSHLLKGEKLFSPRVNRGITILWFIALLCIAVTIELGQFFLPDKVPDLTSILLECAGVWVGFRLSKQLYIQQTERR